MKGGGVSGTWSVLTARFGVHSDQQSVNKSYLTFHDIM